MVVGRVARVSPAAASRRRTHAREWNEKTRNAEVGAGWRAGRGLRIRPVSVSERPQDALTRALGPEAVTPRVSAPAAMREL